jgi:PAS domain S-box-containing protein
MNTLWTRIELRISFIYAVFGGLWIFLSDRLVVLLVEDPLMQNKIQNYKGWFFVLASAILIYIALASALKRQRDAESLRQESQERFQKLFETSMDAILLTAPDGTIFAANPAACRIFGYSEEEILKAGRNGLVDVSDPRLAPALEQRNREGYFSGELTCVRKDGSKFPGEFSSVIFVDRKRQTRTHMLIRDITERKMAENLVIKSRDRLNEVLESMTDAFILLDKDWRVVFINHEAARIHNKPAKECLGKNHWEEWPFTVGTQVEEMYRQVMKKRKPVHFDHHYYEEGQYDLWHEIHAYPYEDGIAIYYHDISDRKVAEEEIHQLTRDLEKRVDERTLELMARNKELETFTYTVSHDLKAPLRGIDGYSKLLLEDHKSSLNAEGQFFLSSIRTATEQMNRLIEDLLQYSRLERRVLSSAVVDLDSLIATMISEREAELNIHKIKVELDLACRQISTDMDGLIIALRNLLDNAIKFTAHVSDPKIKISTREQSGFCILCVADNGIGFDMKYKDKIFDIFQRLHRAEDYPGTGVGLAIARKVMERIGGRAWAKSEPGKGAKFFLEIPL